MGTQTDSAKRVASLLPAATEMICGMGLGERLVGVSHECNWPPSVHRLPRVTRSNIDSGAASRDIDRQVRRLLESGRPLYEIDAAALASCRPDVIVTQTQCDVCAVGEHDVRRAIEQERSLQHARILSLHPTCIDETIDDVDRIGAAIGAADVARRYSAELRDRVDQVRTATLATNSERRPRVAVIEWTDPLMIAGNWIPSMVRDAGGDYGLVDEAALSREIGWAELVAYKPELLIVAPCGFDLQRSLRETQALERQSDWHQLAAVGRGQTYVVDGDAFFNRAGPRQVDALAALAKVVQSASITGCGSSPPAYRELPHRWQRYCQEAEVRTD